VRPIVFHPEAALELQAESVFYNERSAGLGHRLIDQTEHALKLAAAMPGIGSPYLDNTRRVFPKDFPFSIVYYEHGEQIVVVAVAPFKKKPGYWRHRL
jgi:toxin ParE1/3/4